LARPSGGSGSGGGAPLPCRGRKARKLGRLPWPERAKRKAARRPRTRFSRPPDHSRASQKRISSISAERRMNKAKSRAASAPLRPSLRPQPDKFGQIVGVDRVLGRLGPAPGPTRRRGARYRDRRSGADARTAGSCLKAQPVGAGRPATILILRASPGSAARSPATIFLRPA